VLAWVCPMSADFVLWNLDRGLGRCLSLWTAVVRTWYLGLLESMFVDRYMCES